MDTVPNTERHPIDDMQVLCHNVVKQTETETVEHSIRCTQHGNYECVFVQSQLAGNRTIKSEPVNRNQIGAIVKSWPLTQGQQEDLTRRGIVLPKGVKVIACTNPETA